MRLRRIDVLNTDVVPIAKGGRLCVRRHSEGSPSRPGRSATLWRRAVDTIRNLPSRGRFTVLIGLRMPARISTTRGECKCKG